MSDILMTFRNDVRAWLKDNCPAEMRTPIRSDSDVPWGGRRFEWTVPQRRWLDAMVERGWTVPTWSTRYGGAGLDAERAEVLKDEMQRIGARSPLFNYGIVMLAPVLMSFGSEEQKLAHLPAIARGEIRWCQGYSEPGAGSDLASLRTRAVDARDDFIVNGHKVWTSYADASDWTFCLVRTSPDAPKRLGISFLLIDLLSPGVVTRPIRLISGKSRFCEMFFEDVIVPKTNLVGPLNEGWSIAKQLLGHEREAIASNDVDGTDEPVGCYAARILGRDDHGLLSDAMLRPEIARVDLDAMAFDALVHRVRQGHDRGGPDLSSVVKYCGTELSKRRHDLLLDIRGGDGLTWEWDDSETGETARAWLYSRADSIKGGTSEIQLNIIAQRLLQLPRA